MTEAIQIAGTGGRTLSKPRIHGQVVRAIATRILSGEFKPGSLLPSETELCETLKISRSALREAIRVLSAKGLVRTRPRVGTLVRDLEDWSLLDPDMLEWSMASAPSPEFVRSLLEARRVIEPAAARLAAARASAKDVAELEAAYERMERAMPDDIIAFNEADIDFHRGLLRASHNLVFQQLWTTISAALAYSFRVSTGQTRSPAHSLPYHRDVVERIRLRDPEGAHSSMSRLLDIAAIDLALFIGD
jgi:DNA-binding FadR family transcriptional regulator